MRVISLLVWVMACAGCDPVDTALTDPTTDVPLSDADVADAYLPDAYLPDADMPNMAPDPTLDDPSEGWNPAAAPWAAHPAHPFRHWLETTHAYHRIRALPGSTKLVAAHDQGLTILDTALTGEDAVIGWLPLTGRARDFALSADGRRAVVTGQRGLEIVDLTRPTAPVLMGTFTMRDSARVVAISADGRVAFASVWSRVHIIDIRQPDAPTLLGFFETDGIAALATLAAPNLIAVSAAAGLLIVDVSDPGAPSVVGQYPTEYRLDRLAPSQDGRTLFGVHQPGLLVFDLSDPTSPQLMNRTEHIRAGAATDITLTDDEDSLFVAHAGALQIYDVRDRAMPHQRGAFETQYILSVAPAADEAGALVGTTGGLMRIDLRTPGASPMATHPTAEQMSCWQLSSVLLSVDGLTAFVAGHELTAVDIGNGGLPTVYRDLGIVTALAVSADGQHLFAAGRDGLRILNIRRPSAPFVIGTLAEVTAEPKAIVLSDDEQIAYMITEGGGGLYIIDVSDPTAPAQLGQTYLRHTESMTLSNDGETVFVADPYENGLVAFDVRDPQMPAMLGRVPRSISATALSPDGTTLAAASREGLLFIDVRNPAAMEVRVTLTDLGASNLLFSPDGAHLYLTDDAGLRIIDATQGLTESVYDTPGTPAGFALSRTADSVVMLNTEASPCIGAVSLTDPPSLTPIVGTPHFTLRWSDRYPGAAEQIAWHSTHGDVVVRDVDQTAHTAIVEWTRPVGTPVDALEVAVGNHHYYEVARIVPD